MIGSLDELLLKRDVTTREIEYGGNAKEELLKMITEKDISLNEYAKALFSSVLFTTNVKREYAKVIELAIKDLDFKKEATLRSIFEKAKVFGLSLCPLEIGPYLRLNILDQEEEQELGKNKAPKGSITIISKPLKEDDDDFPKGFYIRKMDGILWLRGYCCQLDYVWDVNDRIALML
jgi:hypothetical protein